MPGTKYIPRKEEELKNKFFLRWLKSQILKGEKIMKKNFMMRAASVLLVAVMLTTCAISGTFAKYVTSANTSDNARVAKWGVTVATTGSLFAESYKDLPVASAEDTDDKITVQVKDYASVEQNVVAPGTKNETGMVFTLKGTPEVDTRITFAVDIVDVVLPKTDDLLDYTTGVADDTFDLENDYHPIVFTLHSKDKASVLATGTAATIEKYLEDLNGVYQTNKDLATVGGSNGEFVLTWAWDFDGDQTLDGKAFDADVVDQADTYLGNVAAGIAAGVPAGTSTTVSVAINITVEQVD